MLRGEAGGPGASSFHRPNAGDRSVTGLTARRGHLRAEGPGRGQDQSAEGEERRPPPTHQAAPPARLQPLLYNGLSRPFRVNYISNSHVYQNGSKKQSCHTPELSQRPLTNVPGACETTHSTAPGPRRSSNRTGPLPRGRAVALPPLSHLGSPGDPGGGLVVCSWLLWEGALL